MRWRERGAGALCVIGHELRQAAASPATLLFLMLIGPLTGQAFITAVTTYAEASGAGGGAAALSQGLSPLDGILVPTLGAYAVASTLLFPFVAIRAISGDKASGALRLLLQGRISLGGLIAAKWCVALLIWIVAWIPGVAALLLWTSYGGHLAPGEVGTVLLGYGLRGALVAAIALVASAVTDSAASASVVTLAITLGSWAIDFVAQVRGGTLAVLARFTPEAMLRTFERGELRADASAVALTVALTLLAVAAAWLHPSQRWSRRLVVALAIVSAGAVVAAMAARMRGSIDLSEDQRSSFSAVDERALRALAGPLRVTAHLAPEDPRLTDLERGLFHKLSRVVPDFSVRTISQGTTGLFEKSGGEAQYGEVWYDLAGRRAMSRSTTEPIVLELIYGLAGRRVPTNTETSSYPGYPLVTKATWAAILFYLLWPIAILLPWLLWRRPR